MGRKKAIVKEIEDAGNHSTKMMGDTLVVTRKRGVSGIRIKQDGLFEETRRQNDNFNECAEAGKLLREALKPLLSEIKDKNISARVLRLLSQVKKQCEVQQRSKNIWECLEEKNDMLKGFEFNSNALIKDCLKKEFKISEEGFSFFDIRVTRDIMIPEECSHVKLKGGLLCIDVNNEAFYLEETEEKKLPVNDLTKNIELRFKVKPQSDLIKLPVLLIAFYKGRLKTKGGERSVMGFV